MGRQKRGRKEEALPKPRNYWLLVLSPENFRITQEMGFTIQGVRTRERKKAQRMVPGDRMVFYLTGVRRFPATATVTSEYFEDRSPIWRDSQRGDPYPYRVRIRPEVVLPEEQWLDALDIGPRLEYVRRWTPEMWYLAFFQGQLHLLPQRDFHFLEEEMRKVLRRSRPQPRR